MSLKIRRVLLILRKDEINRIVVPQDNLVYDPGVYWFRDYWANRLKLGRSVPVEVGGIEEKKDLLSNELMVTQSSKEKFNVHWQSGQIDGVVDPFSLVHQLEPQRISLSLKKPGLRDEAPDPNFNMKPEKIQDVTAQPVACAMGNTRIWLQVLLRLIIPIIAIIIFEWVVLSYIVTSNPELIRSTLIIGAISLAAFIYGSLVIFIKIGISESTRQIIGAKATIYFYEGEHPQKFHYKYKEDKPSWLESKPYWVFRYSFTWSFELTLEKGLPVVHASEKDIERLDIWCDARTGEVEWIVSDYHWRELWYRANPNLSTVYVWFPANFHTPKPLIIPIDGKGKLFDLYNKHHQLSKEWMETIEKYRASHTKFLQTKYGKQKPRIMNRILLSQLSSLWWEKWRYPLGANSEIYKDPVISATGEQPNLPVTAQSIPPTPVKTPVVAMAIPVASKTIFQPISKHAPALSVKPITKLAITPMAVHSPASRTKKTNILLYTGIAVAIITSITAVGFYVSKNKKRQI
jgi:hypothetical protein